MEWIKYDRRVAEPYNPFKKEKRELQFIYSIISVKGQVNSPPLGPPEFTPLVG